MEKFNACVQDCILGLNEVLDEGLSFHPLKQQQESVSKYRQIGLGVMGIADMLIKLNMRYGSSESIELCDKISKHMLNSAVKKSALIAKERGAFEKYNKEALLKSPFFINNIDEDVKELVKKYGIRNSQILTIPPTGSISTMLGISGGIEPMFNVSYTRKTETLHSQDVYYKVYTPIVKEYMKIKDISDEKDLPEIFVTAMSLKPQERIAMQAVWQKHIDASISSTINLSYEATKEEVYNIYMGAWENKLKGITIYRDGCERSGVLLNDKKDDKAKEDKIEENHIEEEKFVCPQCGNEAIIPTGGCTICLKCGYSKCN